MLRLVLFLFLATATVQPFPSPIDLFGTVLDSASAINNAAERVLPGPTHLMKNTLSGNDLLGGLPGKIANLGLKTAGDLTRAIQEGLLRTLLAVFHFEQRLINTITDVTIFLLEIPEVQRGVDITIQNAPQVAPLYLEVGQFMAGPEAKPLRLAGQRIFKPLTAVSRKVDKGFRSALHEAYLGLELPRRILIALSNSRDLEPVMGRFQALPQVVELNEITVRFGFDILRPLKNWKENVQLLQDTDSPGYDETIWNKPLEELLNNPKVQEEAADFQLAAPAEQWDLIIDGINRFCDPLPRFLERMSIQSSKDVITRVRDYGKMIVATNPERESAVEVLQNLVIHLVEAERVQPMVDALIESLPKLPKIIRGIEEFLQDPENRALLEPLQKLLVPVKIVQLKLFKELSIVYNDGIAELEETMVIVKEEVQKDEVQDAIDKLVALDAFTKLNEITEKYDIRILVHVRKIKGATLAIQKLPPLQSLVDECAGKVRRMYEQAQECYLNQQET